MLYLSGPTASVSPEHPERISSFISSTYRHVPLMAGAGFEPYTPPMAFLDSLPAAGNCALGGCGDAYSEHACTNCGCSSPGCNGFPQAAVSNPQLMHSSTDCTVPGEACANWLSFHNCYPSLPPSHMGSICK